MADENGKRPIAGQELIKAEVDGNPGKLRGIARQAIRALGATRRGINDHDDAVVSAVGSALRHQDPEEEMRGGQLRDPEITDRNQVWPLIEKHLNKKLNTFRSQRNNLCNSGVREGDLVSDAARDHWKEAFVDPRKGPQRADPEQVESFVADALATLRELVDAERLHAIARLRLMGHTQEEIATILEISNYDVRVGLHDVRILLTRSENLSL